MTSQSPLARKPNKILPELIIKKPNLNASHNSEETKEKHLSNFEIQKLKVRKMKDLLQENRDKKIKEAKFAKESNRLLRENLMMLKDLMM